MKKLLLISLILLSSTSFAETVYFSDGSFATVDGNTTYYSRGGFSTRSGNTIYNSDGTSATWSR